jgi:hypothetical protein
VVSADFKCDLHLSHRAITAQGSKMGAYGACSCACSLDFNVDFTCQFWSAFVNFKLIRLKCLRRILMEFAHRIFVFANLLNKRI